MTSSGIEPQYIGFTTKKHKKVEYKKVICIDNEGEDILELNKLYYADVLEKSESYSKYYSKMDLEVFYFIFTEPVDKTTLGVYHRNRFITIAEWRERQINAIIE